MKGKTPNKLEKEWLKKVCEFGCIVCFLHENTPEVPCSPHHINGRTKPGSHFNTIGLCHKHHQLDDSNQAYESVHGNKYRFEKRYGTQLDLLEHLKRIILT